MSEQEISREDLDLIDRIFDIIDINADGTVDIQKLKQNLPSCCEGARLNDVQAILDEMAGNIDWTDFIDALKLGLIHQKEEGSTSVLDKEEEEEDIQEWTLRREQTKKAKVHRLDTQKDPLTKEMRKGLLKMFNRMDPDGDGYVTLQEFQGYMMEHRSAIGSKKIVELFNKINKNCAEADLGAAEMSAAYMSRTRNPLLVKDDVGRAKPSCYKLPPEDFSYGRPDMPDYEGAREVTMQWVAHHAEAKKEADVQDFKKLNKMAVKEKVFDSRKLTQYRKDTNVPLTSVSHAAPPKVYPSEVVPSFTYGKKTRPSTPIAQVISNQFAAEYEASLAEIYDYYDKEKKEAKQMGKIRTTKAAEGHAKKLMEPEDTGHKEPFKLSKFKHVKSKMGSLPGTRKPASQVVQAAPDVLDVEAEGAA